MDLIKTYLNKYIYLIVGLVALATLVGAVYFTYSLTDSHWQAKWNKRDAAEAQASAEAIAANRAKEQGYQNELNSIQLQAEARNGALQRDIDAASDSVKRLQQRLSSLSVNASTSNTRATANSETAKLTTGMLADMLSKSLDRNRVLAETADKARAAGLTCEKAYTAIAK